MPALLVGLAVGAFLGLVVTGPIRRLSPTKAKVVLGAIAASPIVSCCLVTGAAMVVQARNEAREDEMRDRLQGSVWASDIGHALVFYADGTFGGGIVDREGRRFILFEDTHGWRIQRGELCMVGDDLIWACDRATVLEDRIGLTECRSGDCATMWFTATDVEGWECSGEWCGSFEAQRVPR